MRSFLKLWGHDVTVILSHDEDKLKQVTKDQLNIWKNFGGELASILPSSTGGIIDGLLGYSLDGDPRGKSADLIKSANSTGAPILSLDVPTGLDATTGEARDPCIRANMTVVYGVMKKGLEAESAKDFAGEIELVDIGLKR